ncbi:MAG: HIT domain-containing protein [Anaerolineales bacterium]|nr:HIT domain-containing protein [Anaerolineales bacterium]
MKRLWTPWRMPYLKAPKKSKERGCIFCNKIRARRSKDRDNLVVVRSERAFIVLNLYPYTNGHLMVAPYQHTGELESLDGATLQEMMLLVGASIRALRAMMNPQGFNVGINLGSVAGAGVKDHVHIHVVPRWGGDTNFMPVLADVRMIPELLPQTYDKLLEVFQTLKKSRRIPIKRQSKKKG